MENVILTIHLILALCLIGTVLLQRSEGGGLGMGSGGGGGGGVMSGRAAATALGKLTWIFAVGFIATSIAMTVIAARNSAGGSVIDRLGTEAPGDAGSAIPGLPDGESLLPPDANIDTAPGASGSVMPDTTSTAPTATATTGTEPAGAAPDDAAPGTTATSDAAAGTAAETATPDAAAGQSADPAPEGTATGATGQVAPATPPAADQ